MTGPMILDQVIWMQHIGTDLIAPARIDILAFQRCQLSIPLLAFHLEQARLEDFQRPLTVLRLAALILALNDDPCRQMDQADGSIVLLDVLPPPRRCCGRSQS